MAENTSRAFLYGESVFTTMRMINGKLMDWELHFERLKKSVEYVYGPFLDEKWEHILKQQFEEKMIPETGDKIIRLTVHREKARGLGRAELIGINQLKINMLSSVIEEVLLEKRINLRTAPAENRPHWWPSYLKAGNYLFTILSQKMKLEPGDDDLLFLSPNDEVFESSVANIFVVRNNKLYTAPLGPNVLDGVMRRKVIGVADMLFDEVIESASSLEQLYKADAVFGTNSVRGPFLIGKVNEHTFQYSSGFLDLFENLKRLVLK